MKKLSILLLFLSFINICHAQKKYVDSLNNILSNTKDPLVKFTCIVKIEENNYTGGDGNIDTLHIMELHKIAQQLNNDSLLAISYNWIGGYFLFTMGDNTTALEYLFKGLPLAERTKDKRRISSYYFDIANCYSNLNNTEESTKYLRKGADNLPDPQSPMYDYMIRQFQVGMATNFLVLNLPDSALHYAQALNETNLRLKNISFEAFVNNCFGDIQSQNGDNVLAETYFKKANKLADSTQFYLTKLSTKSAYARFLLNNNRNREAIEITSNLFKLGNEINNNQIKVTCATLLKKAFKNLHNSDSAYYYLQMESSLKDSIFSQNNINKIQTMSFNEQLRIIDEKSKIEQEGIQRKLNLQYALIALSIITLIILYLLLSRSFITNTKLIEFFGIIALLIVFEFLNLLLHPFLEKITDHSPILMLLILVGIAALLVPLHHRVEKWATKKIVEKNKKVRLANAKKTIEKLEGNNL